MPYLDYIKDHKNKLANNLSGLLCLPLISQIAEGKKLIEPAIVTEDKDKEGAFLIDYDYFCMIDDDINVMFECYINNLRFPTHRKPAELFQNTRTTATR